MMGLCDGEIDNDAVLIESDVCDFTPSAGTPILVPASRRSGTIRGDHDGYCDCDLADYAGFSLDFSGAVAIP